MALSAGSRLAPPIFAPDEKAHRRAMAVWMFEHNQIHSWGSIDVRQFGASVTGTPAGNLTAIQLAIDTVYARGAGVVEINELYTVNGTVDVPQRVWLVGPVGGFVNQFVSNVCAPKGAGLFLATGSNVDLVRFRCRLTNDAGTLKETTHGWQNSEARHFGGARNLVFWGNRSLDQAYTAVDLNNAGNGILISGSRYVTLENITAAYCADDGVETASHDYGTGALPTNNIQLLRPNCLSNAGHGMRIAGGDMTIVAPNCGSNAFDGILWTSSGTFNGGLLWNNGRHGIQSTGMTDTANAAFDGIHAYDNDETGFRVGTGRAPTLTGCVGRGNGRDASATAADRCNFWLSTAAEGWSFAGCRSYARDQSSTLVTQYGFYINNTTYSGTLDGCTDEGSVTPDFIADGTKIICHVGTTTTIDHPGMRMLGNLNVNTKILMGIQAMRFQAWSTISAVSASSIQVGSNALISLDISGGAVISDMSYSSSGIPMVVLRNINVAAVTINHSTTKLRCANATAVVLSQHEAVSFLWISGAVWQQVGGAF